MVEGEAEATIKRGRKRPLADDGGVKRQAEIATPVFGYKNHVGIDRAYGFIRTSTVTHAAAHDGGQLAALLDPANLASGVWADTAYRSAANLKLLDRHGLIAQFQRAKPRGKPMPAHVARGNTTRGRIRARVEHVFAAQKHRLGLIVRTIGLARARTKITLANLTYNMRRLAWFEGKTLLAFSETPRQPPQRPEYAANSGSIRSASHTNHAMQAYGTANLGYSRYPADLPFIPSQGNQGDRPAGGRAAFKAPGPC